MKAQVLTTTRTGARELGYRGRGAAPWTEAGSTLTSGRARHLPDPASATNFAGVFEGARESRLEGARGVEAQIRARCRQGKPQPRSYTAPTLTRQCSSRCPRPLPGQPPNGARN